ncbi:hypothetical protein NBRC116599_42490 [Aquicoccus sp. SU-CL01552]
MEAAFNPLKKGAHKQIIRRTHGNGWLRQIHLEIRSVNKGNPPRQCKRNFPAGVRSKHADHCRNPGVNQTIRGVDNIICFPTGITYDEFNLVSRNSTCQICFSGG